MPLILIRYNELGLKSPKVRRRFQGRLVKNIEEAFLKNKQECIIDSTWGRIYVHTKELEKGVEILQRIFGISSVSVVEVGTGGLDEIIKAVVEFSASKIGSEQSFAVRSRRYGEHDFSSMELAQKLGAAIMEELKPRNIRVDLSKPNVSIYVEVRREKFYYFTKKEQAVGGLPLGTQGKILGVYENPRSFLAWWLMLKRGATVIPIYLTDKSIFDYENPIEIIDDEQLREIVVDFQKWVPNFKFRFYNVNNDQNNDAELMLYDDLMKEYGEKFKIDAFVSGKMLDDMGNGFKTYEKNDFNIPIFYPLIALSNEELAQLEQKVF